MDTVELLKDSFDAPEAAGTESRDGENCIHYTFFMLVSRSTSTNEKDLLFYLNFILEYDKRTQYFRVK